MDYTLTSFRPLPGDLISQYCDITTSTLFLKLFPSPSRGSYFSIRENDRADMLGISVSVPFPGILFLNHLKLTVTQRVKLNVSVPFPGILFLNDRQDVDIYNRKTGFPSPSRGSYFSILSFTCLILTGFQSRIAVQNQIRLWNKLLSP